MMKADTPKPGERRWALRVWNPGRPDHGTWVGEVFGVRHESPNDPGIMMWPEHSQRGGSWGQRAYLLEWRETEEWVPLPEEEHPAHYKGLRWWSMDPGPGSMRRYGLYYPSIVGSWHIVEDPFEDREIEPEPEGGDADGDGAGNSGPADVTPGGPAQEPADPPARDVLLRLRKWVNARVRKGSKDALMYERKGYVAVSLIVDAEADAYRDIVTELDRLMAEKG